MIKSDKYGELVATCDECGTEEYGGVNDFRSFVEHLKEIGWKISRPENDWIHICPECT